MKQERWLRIIPVAVIIYTISCVDRANAWLTKAYQSTAIPCNAPGVGMLFRAKPAFLWPTASRQVRPPEAPPGR